jgi:hypothetical protein
VVLCLAIGCEDTTDDPHPVPDADSGAGGSHEHASDSRAASQTKERIDRSTLKDVGTDGPLDYADRRNWLCRPGNDPGECDINQDATELLADGSRNVIQHQAAEEPKVDCFYEYPTVKLTSPGPMTDFTWRYL